MMTNIVWVALPTFLTTNTRTLCDIAIIAMLDIANSILPQHIPHN